MWYKKKNRLTDHSWKFSHRRKRMFSSACILFFCLFLHPCFANQEHQGHNYAVDTSKVNKYIKYASDSMQVGQLRVSMDLADSAMKLATQIHYRTGMGICLNLKGRILYRTASFDSAILFSQKALILAKDLNDSALLSSAYLNLGNAYYSKGNHTMASDYYFKGLSIEEKLQVQPNLYGFLNNIGGVFTDQKNLPKGLEYYLKSKAVAEKLHNNKRLSTVYHNLGSLYIKMGKIDDAHISFEKSYALAKSLNDIYMMNLYPSNMAEVYKQRKDYNKAYLYSLKSLQIQQEQGFKDQIANTLMTLAEIQINRAQYEAAENYLKQALFISEEIHTKTVTKDIYQQLARLYDLKGDYPKAYANYTLFSNIKDTLLNQENSRLITEMNTKYTTEQKEREIELLRKNEDIQKLELSKDANDLERQRTFSITILTGFLLLMIVAVLIYSRYHLKKKANEDLQKAYNVIDEKNKIIEKSNMLITDSITYAKRIQDAILPSDQDLEKLFPGNHFVFYQPSQIVSGDFYWCSQQDGKIIIAIADCTGHGVSGAFMSLIGNTLLNEIVNERKITNTKEIAKLLDKKIIQSLHQHEGSGKYDGMDISICCIDKDGKSITFTGAHQVMYAYNGNLHKIKCDPYSIGGAQQQNAKLFTSQSFDYEDGLCLYFLTDGYCDQSGGPQNKRFSFSRFEKLVMQMQDKNMPEQKEKIQQVFEEWKVNTKQRDDVLVIGIKC